MVGIGVRCQDVSGYEKGINFMYVDKWWCLHYLKACNATALSTGQSTANLTYNIVNDSDIDVRTYHLSYLLET